jgi:hypothetical protein
MTMLDSSQGHGTGVGRWDAQLERCPDCKRDMVQPASYEPLWGDRWLICRECPNCGWEHEGVFPHEALRAFEEHLDAVDDLLWDHLVKIQQERIDAEVKALAGALAANAILPEDF